MRTAAAILLVLVIFASSQSSRAGIYLVNTPETYASAVQDQPGESAQSQSIVPPPEPALLALFAAGVLSMIGLGWIKRKQFTETSRGNAV